MNKFKQLTFVFLSVSIIVASFGSIGNCWQPPNPVMDPSMVPMGPPMQGPPMGMPINGQPMCPPMSPCQPMQPPSFCGPSPMGMMPCQPRQNFIGPLTLTAGYVSTFKNSQVRREVGSNGITATPSYEFKVPTQGAWLGASQIFYVGRKCGIVGSGGILVPSKTHGTVVEQGTPGIITPLSDVDVDNQWGRVDGAGFCEVFRTQDCNFGFLILGGFRWDYFEQKIDGTAVDINGGSGTFKDDLTVNSYLPYLGAQFSFTPCNSSANVRFIVSPGMWGEMKLDDTNLPLVGSGHLKAPFQWGNFWELYAVYSLGLFDCVEAGAYFDWTFLELVSEARNNTFVVPALTTTVAAVTSTTLNTPERIHLHRNTWSVGGTLKLSFDFGI